MKLLNRTLLRFLGYAVALLIVVTPVLYIVINNLIIDRVDDTLLLHKREIQSRLEKLPTDDDVRQWEDLDGEVFVEPFDGPVKADSIYTLSLSNPHNEELESYRILVSSAIIKGKSYRMEARISLVESEDLAGTLVVTQFCVLVVLIVGMLIINWWNARTIWKPFYFTLGALRSFRIEKNTKINLTSSDTKEFNDLNDAIVELTKRDQYAFVAQREFTENAAHEMQTPLAIFQSKIDLLLQTKLSEEQASLMESLLDATSRLNRLNKALILLARIDNEQFPEKETCDLDVVTDRLRSLFDGDITSKQLRFIVESQQKCEVTLNGPLLEILLSNLITNAIRHSEKETAITILINKDAWQIRNSGQPLTIATDKIFERFRKGTANQASLGLGLAIARKICDACNVSLAYSYESGDHVFSLRFHESKKSTESSL